MNIWQYRDTPERGQPNPPCARWNVSFVMRRRFLCNAEGQSVTYLPAGQCQANGLDIECLSNQCCCV